MSLFFPTDFSITSLHQSVLLEISPLPRVGRRHSPSGSRLRLFQFGELVWERTLSPCDPCPRRAWVHDSGMVVLVGDWGHGRWLTVLEPETGAATCAPRSLDDFARLADWRPDGQSDWLRFATAHFLVLAERGLCFSLRTAPGPRLLLNSKGAFVPHDAQEEELARAEAERALTALAEAKGTGKLPHERSPEARDRLGAATLCATEQHLIEAVPALRALEWGGGPCRPGLRRPGDLDPCLATIHDLRRLAQRALLRLGATPRPLPGATVVRVGPAAALHTSLEDRAEAVEDLPPGLTPDEVIRRAGQPDDVGATHWDYGLYTDRARTIRVHWDRNAWGHTKVGRLEALAMGAATSRYDGFEQPLD